MKIKNWMKFVLFLWCVTLLVLMITLAVHGQEEPTELTNQGDLAIGAGIAIGLAGLGAGLGMGNASSSAIGSITEKPEVFGKSMIERNRGCILNVSSMNAFRPLTGTPAYAAAKAAVSNFTQWLAVHVAQEYSPNIRVNAIAPGFFMTEQNRFLLTDEATGELTLRGHTIIKHTPMGRFGIPKDLIGTVIWLLSPAASSFITGIVVPVDGGFNAFSGV